MDFRARAKSIQTFTEEDDKRILLASLKCGGCKCNTRSRS
jgi:hypothetical protein